MIGGLLMTHSDDDGLVLPPRIAPVQAVVVPLYKNDAEQAQVLPFAEQVRAALGGVLEPLRVQMDKRDDMRPADRFFYWAQQGVPLRVEVGPRDVTGGVATLVRRDNRAKQQVTLEAIGQTVPALLETMQQELYQKAKDFRIANTHRVDSYDDFKAVLEGEGGFIEAHWNGTSDVEAKIKEETKATIRLIPMDGDPEPGRCMVTGEPSARRVVFAIAY
jgi:prolyl-tRNA synthetase